MPDRVEDGRQLMNLEAAVPFDCSAFVRRIITRCNQRRVEYGVDMRVRLPPIRDYLALERSQQRTGEEAV